jgi:hypothetical protein
MLVTLASGGFGSRITPAGNASSTTSHVCEISARRRWLSTFCRATVISVPM